MKFLVDAQLPHSLARMLNELGHDALHTVDLPNGNRSKDAELAAFAARDDRIVVTKDRDFVDSLLLRHHPSRLLLVATGNISNRELLELFRTTLPRLESAFADANYVEFQRHVILIHG